MIDELMFADGLVPNEYLAHIGRSKLNGAKVGSGRYPLGSGKNPYHHGTMSPFGRLRERRLEKKKAAAKTAQLEKARQTKIDKAEYERKKEEALKSGSARQMAPYIKDLSYNELKDLKNRLQLEAEFRDIAVKEAAQGNPKVAVAVARAERITKQVNTAMDSYNAFAKVYNTFSNKGELPLIGTNSRSQIKYKKLTDAELLKQKKAATDKLTAEAQKAKAEARAARALARDVQRESIRKKREYEKKQK